MHSKCCKDMHAYRWKRVPLGAGVSWASFAVTFESQCPLLMPSLALMSSVLDACTRSPTRAAIKETCHPWKEDLCPVDAIILRSKEPCVSFGNGQLLCTGHGHIHKLHAKSLCDWCMREILSVHAGHGVKARYGLAASCLSDTCKNPCE